MLVIDRILARARRTGDDGAVLVTVVVVMLVGFVVAAVIAGAVFFTIQSNDQNRDRTEAFIAAESGRDAQLAKVMAAGCGGAGTLVASNTNVASPPRYDATASGCFDPYITSTVTIDSTGIAPDGSVAEVTSVYQRAVTYQNQPGGTMSYFDGQFVVTQSTYTGDLVIREGNYTCNSHSVIAGDLWVLNGNADLSAECTINGNAYIKGTVSLGNGAGATVNGDVVAGGSITQDGNKALVTGNLVSNGAVSVTKGKVKGFVRAGGAASASNGTVDGEVHEKLTPPPAVFTPDLATVYSMTTWVDLPMSRSAWGSDGAGGANVDWHAGPCDGADVMSILTATPAAGTSRIGIDYTACTGPVTITLSGGTPTLSRDAVFLVAPRSTMSLKITNTLRGTSSPQPQLFFIRGDARLGNAAPDCGTSAGSDDITLPSTVQAKLMFYTPCGLGRASQNGLVFNGQFYSNVLDSAHWVHPDFTCQPMRWVPMLDMGCKVAEAVVSDGTAIPVPQLPALISQTE